MESEMLGGRACPANVCNSGLQMEVEVESKWGPRVFLRAYQDEVRFGKLILPFWGPSGGQVGLMLATFSEVFEVFGSGMRYGGQVSVPYRVSQVSVPYIYISSGGGDVPSATGAPLG